MTPVVPALFLLAGLLVGLAFFALLQRGVALLLAPGRTLSPVLLLALLRYALMVLLLAAAVRQGAVPLLAAFAGVLAARILALRFRRSDGAPP